MTHLIKSFASLTAKIQRLKSATTP